MTKIPEGLPEDTHMLSQPLMTDEGFVNPACINELENVIANMPETYDRLKDDPEWGTKRRWEFVHDITGPLAMWAVILSPFSCPDGLEDVIRYLAPCLTIELEKLPDDRRCGTPPYMFHITLCEVNKLLHDILGEFDQVVAWNEPKISEGPGYENRHQQPHPNYDFIDLGALFHNVCIHLRNEGRNSDAFDERFEREQSERRKP